MICSLSRALLVAALLGITVPAIAMEGEDRLPTLEQALALVLLAALRQLVGGLATPSALSDSAPGSATYWEPTT